MPLTHKGLQIPADWQNGKVTYSQPAPPEIDLENLYIVRQLDARSFPTDNQRRMIGVAHDPVNSKYYLIEQERPAEPLWPNDVEYFFNIYMFNNATNWDPTAADATYTNLKITSSGYYVSASIERAVIFETNGGVAEPALYFLGGGGRTGFMQPVAKVQIDQLANNLEVECINAKGGFWQGKANLKNYPIGTGNFVGVSNKDLDERFEKSYPEGPIEVEAYPTFPSPAAYCPAIDCWINIGLYPFLSRFTHGQWPWTPPPYELRQVMAGKFYNSNFQYLGPSGGGPFDPESRKQKIVEMPLMSTCYHLYPYLTEDHFRCHHVSYFDGYLWILVYRYNHLDIPAGSFWDGDLLYKCSVGSFTPSTLIKPSHMAVGTDATAFTPNQNALVSETHREEITDRGVLGGEAHLGITIAAGDIADETVLRESGLFTLSAAGDMLARTLGLIHIDADLSYKIDYKLEVIQK